MHSKIMIRRMKAAEKAAEQWKKQTFHIQQRQYFLEMAKAVRDETPSAHQVISPTNKPNDDMEAIQLAQPQRDQPKSSQQDASSARFKIESDYVKSTHISSPSRTHSTNSDKWDRNLQDLLNFRKGHGHCLVPDQWSENKRLARWVKRQRYQHKLKKDGLRTALTDEREDALEVLGFVWEPHEVRWEERLNDLHFYKNLHGTCNVPGTCTYSPRLADWVKSQRRHYRCFMKGQPSKLTQERISKLDEMGFTWNPLDLDLRPVESK